MENQAPDHPDLDINEDLTKEQLDALLKLFSGKKQKESTGNRRLRIFRYLYKHPEARGHGGRKEISKALGIPPSTVSDDIKFIEKQAKEIKKIIEM
jgi:DNA-binding MarR family transcriptional regulator